MLLLLAKANCPASFCFTCILKHLSLTSTLALREKRVQNYHYAVNTWETKPKGSNYSIFRHWTSGRARLWSDRKEHKVSPDIMQALCQEAISKLWCKEEEAKLTLAFSLKWWNRGKRSRRARRVDIAKNNIREEWAEIHIE